MKTAVIVVVLTVLVESVMVNGDQIRCAIAPTACVAHTVLPTASCSQKKPFFDCLKQNGCATSDTVYIGLVATNQYGSCNSGGHLAATFTLPIILFFISKL